MIVQDNIIIADAGKELRRVSDGTNYGNSIILGYSYYINGVLQDQPHLDVVEDFEEIDSSEEISDEEALKIIMEGE